MTISAERLCARCHKEPRGSHVAYCKSCWNAYQSEYRRRRYATESDYRDSMRSHQLKMRYGISNELFDEMLQRQGGVCAICKTSCDENLHVDHDHETGTVRGLLCRPCNRALGMFKDNRELVLRAAEYLAIYDN